MNNPTITNLQKKLNDPHLIDKLSSQLSKSELNSLLLEVMRIRAEEIVPSQLMNAYLTNRFVQPSVIDALAFSQAEVKLFEISKINGFSSLECSPVAPFGNCSALALVNQNKVVSALRGTEVVADATNLLALEASLRRKRSGFDDTQSHLCTVHRHVRAQALPPIKGFTAHFKLFCALSAGKDLGNFEFEKQALLKHLILYRDIINALQLKGISVTLKFLQDSGSEKFKEVIQNHIDRNLNDIEIEYITVPKSEHQYYERMRFSLNVKHKGQELNIGDGGFLDWAQKLTNNKKERLLSSGLGLELILKMQLGLL